MPRFEVPPKGADRLVMRPCCGRERVQLTRSWVRPHETIFRCAALVGARDGRVCPRAGWQRAPARPQREKVASVGVELRGGRSAPRPRRGRSSPPFFVTAPS